MSGLEFTNPPLSAPLPLAARTALRLCVRLSCVELLIAVGVIALTPGCQSFQPDWSKNWFTSPRVQESKYAVPARMAILWSPAIYNEAGKMPTRGFGGRVYFYDAKNKPVAVEGQLVIYAY